MEDETSDTASQKTTRSKRRGSETLNRNTASKSAAKKPATKKAASVEPRDPVATDEAAPATSAWEDVGSNEPEAEGVSPAMRKKELIAAVVERSGLKKKDVKPVVEATLGVLGDAMRADRNMNLPPFGKLRVQKVKKLRNARVTLARFRQPLLEEGAETND